MSSQERKKFPFEFKPLLPEETARLKKNYNASIDYVRLEPGGLIFSAEYKDDAENIYNMPIKPDDVIVYTYPRSGTTWTQEMAWLIMKDLDYEAARAVPLTKRYTFLEFSALFTLESEATDRVTKLHKDLNFEGLRNFKKLGSELLANSPSPRFIKTHLPLSFLPPTTLDTAKVIYVARDPRDAAVSFYHQNKLLKFYNYIGDFKTYWELFMDDLIMWCPYFEHVKAAWELRHHPNMLFLFYEDICKDLPATIRRVAEFLGKQLSNEQVATLSDHLSFDIFKKNDSVNFSELKDFLDSSESFIRKGKVGGWREYFDEQMALRAEQWIADNLRNTDLRFPQVDR